MSYERKNKIVDERHLNQTIFIQDYAFGKISETHVNAV